MILSIIIPVFNVERFIRKTLNSIYAQSFPEKEIEVIVVDDGSPDASMNIVQEYADKYKNLIIYRQKNKGLSEARNSGMKIASGDFVWFVDGDDWIENGILLWLITKLRVTDRDVLQFKLREYNEEYVPLRESNSPDETNSFLCEGYKAFDLSRKFCFWLTPIQKSIIRRKFLEDNKLFFLAGIYHEDVEIIPRILLRTNRVEFIPKVSYCYLLRNSGSITTTPANSAKRTWSYVKIYESLNQEKQFFSAYEKEKVLQMLIMSIARVIWCRVTMDEYKKKYMEFHLDEIEHLIRKKILFGEELHSGFVKALKRMLFFINPKALKRIGKDIEL